MITDPRTDPPRSGDELTLLRGFLTFHRETLRWKTADLDATQLDQKHGPSTMTLGGMLKHLAFVESYWFTEIFQDGPALPPFDTVDWDADADWDWHSAAGETATELWGLLDRAIDASDAVVAQTLADPEGAGLDTRSVRAARDGDRWNLRWILIHMIEEYSRHNGHADLIREAIDGSAGE
ncbi:DinB family protein [Oerskovia sp. NPDC060287]|uniref:DinB family protein n=1 Tax=Oerskovia sp. NPDC060287 TaxID=3347095 RepID=UPI00364A17D1